MNSQEAQFFLQIIHIYLKYTSVTIRIFIETNLVEFHTEHYILF